MIRETIAYVKSLLFGISWFYLQNISKKNLKKCLSISHWLVFDILRVFYYFSESIRLFSLFQTFSQTFQTFENCLVEFITTDTLVFQTHTSFGFYRLYTTFSVLFFGSSADTPCKSSILLHCRSYRRTICFHLLYLLRLDCPTHLRWVVRYWWIPNRMYALDLNHIVTETTN